jgi:hypothetical protein
MEILDARQQNFLRRPERRLLDLKIVSGGVCARRIIEQELARRTPGTAVKRVISLLSELTIFSDPSRT